METFEKLNAAFMPLVFVAKHDESEASNVFSRTWNEASSSGSGSVRPVSYTHLDVYKRQLFKRYLVKVDFIRIS